MQACLTRLLEQAKGQTVLLVRHSGALVAWQGQGDSELITLHCQLRRAPEVNAIDLRDLLLYRTLLLGSVWRGMLVTWQAIGEPYRLELGYYAPALETRRAEQRQALEQAARELHDLLGVSSEQTG